MKVRDVLIKDLPRGLRDRIAIMADRYHLIVDEYDEVSEEYVKVPYIYDESRDTLEESFRWASTPEGHEFWEGIWNDGYDGRFEDKKIKQL